MAKSMKLGGGGRFEKGVEKLSHDKGVRDPAAVMAAAGRKKYGKTRFQRMAKRGRARRQAEALSE